MVQRTSGKQTTGKGIQVKNVAWNDRSGARCGLLLFAQGKVEPDWASCCAAHSAKRSFFRNCPARWGSPLFYPPHIHLVFRLQLCKHRVSTAQPHVTRAGAGRSPGQPSQSRSFALFWPKRSGDDAGRLGGFRRRNHEKSLLVTRNCRRICDYRIRAALLFEDLFARLSQVCETDTEVHGFFTFHSL